MVDGYFATLSTTLGIPLWFLVVILLWSAVWKLLALWKSARKGSVTWFIVLAVVNSVGILPILYIYVFSEMGKRKVKRTVRRKTVRKK